MDLHTVIVAGVAFAAGLAVFGLPRLVRRTENKVDDALAGLLTRAIQDPDAQAKLVAFLEKLLAPKGK